MRWMRTAVFPFAVAAFCLYAVLGCRSPEAPITDFVVDTYNPTGPNFSAINWVMDLFDADGTLLASGDSSQPPLDIEHLLFPYIHWADLQQGAEYFVRIRPETAGESAAYAIRLLLTSPENIAQPRAASWYFASDNPADPAGSPYDWPPTSYQELAAGLAGKLNCYNSGGTSPDEVDWFHIVLP